MLATKYIWTFSRPGKQHLRGDQVFPVHIAFCLLLVNMGLVLLWRSQASMSSLRVRKVLVQDAKRCSQRNPAITKDTRSSLDMNGKVK